MSGIWMGVASLALTAYSSYEQNQAAKNAAKVDTAVADYNAKYDEEAAKQLDLNTLQNIDTERADAAVYMSRQQAGYAGAGVLATSGSPLAALITTAGRFEQKIQQDYVDSQQKQQSYYAAAKVGQLEGAAQADADRMKGTIALINGAASIASSVSGAYSKGMFTIKGDDQSIPKEDLF